MATYWGLTDAAGLLIYSAELDDEIEVSEADSLVSFTPSIFFDDII